MAAGAFLSFHTAKRAQFVTHYYLGGIHHYLPDILFSFPAMDFPDGEDKEEVLGGKGALNCVREGLECFKVLTELKVPFHSVSHYIYLWKSENTKFPF